MANSQKSGIAVFVIAVLIIVGAGLYWQWRGSQLAEKSEQDAKISDQQKSDFSDSFEELLEEQKKKNEEEPPAEGDYLPREKLFIQEDQIAFLISNEKFSAVIAQDIGKDTFNTSGIVDEKNVTDAFFHLETTQLAYTTPKGLYLVNTESTEHRALATSIEGKIYAKPTISPNGTKIAALESGDSGRLVVYDTSSQEFSVIKNNEEDLPVASYQWTNANTLIVAAQENERQNLLLSNTSLSSFENILESEIEEKSKIVQIARPDGGELFAALLQKENEQEYAIKVINGATKQQVVQVDFDNERAPEKPAIEWKNSNKTLVLSAQNKVYELSEEKNFELNQEKVVLEDKGAIQKIIHDYYIFQTRFIRQNDTLTKTEIYDIKNNKEVFVSDPYQFISILHVS